ncbi:hypothetical protein [Nocardia brasiliensis]|uniref:hypothetical protein n=1 Tax=Nocardia brasiliensis TaxID=37326 RepID=UPI002457D1E4|nr:hypothetical protein [Nocardia brasiliensis]
MTSVIGISSTDIRVFGWVRAWFGAERTRFAMTASSVAPCISSIVLILPLAVRSPRATGNGQVNALARSRLRRSGQRP